MRRWYHWVGGAIALALLIVQWRMFLKLAVVYGAVLLVNLLIPWGRK